MKKLICFSILTFGISPFGLGCSINEKELYGITDSFVESLQTIYDVYGILDGKKRIKTTSDGQYQVMPVGRLIKVKIIKGVSNGIYKELEEDLENHYKNDNRVNDVYIDNARTIIIDCRN